MQQCFQFEALVLSLSLRHYTEALDRALEELKQGANYGRVLSFSKLRINQNLPYIYWSVDIPEWFPDQTLRKQATCANLPELPYLLVSGTP